MFEIDLGKIRFNWRGDYDPLETYTRNDVVAYGGSSWVAQAFVDTGGYPGVNLAWAAMAKGSNLVEGVTSADDYKSFTVRDGSPIYKPQGLIQTQYKFLGGGGNTAFPTNPRESYALGRTLVTTANTWRDFDSFYYSDYDGTTPAEWQDVGADPFVSRITPKFDGSIVKVSLSASAGQNGDVSMHLKYRILRSSDGGTTWELPLSLSNQWAINAGSNYPNNMGIWGSYETTTSAAFIYQYNPVERSFIDWDVEAGTEYRYKLQTFTSVATTMQLNYTEDANEAYGLNGVSYWILEEHNNGD